MENQKALIYNNMIIFPKERNINIQPKKIDKRKNLYFTSIINPRLPEEFNDWSYDNNIK